MIPKKIDSRIGVSKKQLLPRVGTCSAATGACHGIVISTECIIYFIPITDRGKGGVRRGFYSHGNRLCSVVLAILARECARPGGGRDTYHGISECTVCS